MPWPQRLVVALQAESMQHFPDSRALTGESPFVYCLGDSHVRSMSADPGFLPLFIGAGRQNCFITDAHAEEATDRIFRNFRRLDSDKPVILVFGEPDVRFYLENQFNARTLGGPDARSYIGTCADRYLRVIAALGREFANPIFVSGVVPRPDARYNALAHEYNRLLRAKLTTRNELFVNIWDAIVEGSQGPLQARFSADGIHLNHRVAPILRELLEGHGLTLDPKPTDPFAWSYFYRIDFDGDHNTRIWGDARLDSQSPEFAASQIARDAAARLVELVPVDLEKGTLVVNCREGLVPLALPENQGVPITGIDPSPERVVLSKRLTRFANRSDIDTRSAAIEDIAPHHTVIDFCLGESPVTDRGANLRHLARKTRSLLCLLDRDKGLGDQLKALGFCNIVRVAIEVTTKSGDHANVLWLARRSDDHAPDGGER